MNEQIRFLKQWVAAPLQVAAVAPSGQALARLMTEHYDSTRGPVIELGPGTGVFTRAMLDRGLRQRDLALVELNTDFAERLQREFPDAMVLNKSAGDLQGPPIFEAQAGMVLSGLGFLAMPDALVSAILRGAFQQMRPDGLFVQFTYGPQCPVAPDILQSLGLTAIRTGRTWRNLPPASVYVIKRANLPN